METVITYGIIIIVLIIISLIVIRVTRRDFKIEANKLIGYLGGKDNIVSKQIAGSRVAVVLKDYSLINEAQLKEVGVASFIKMSNKITLVIKGDSSSFFKALD